MAKLISESRQNFIRGKASVGHATPEEIVELFEHIYALEDILDDWDLEDFFGTEGWRSYSDYPE